MNGYTRLSIVSAEQRPQHNCRRYTAPTNEYNLNEVLTSTMPVPLAPPNHCTLIPFIKTHVAHKPTATSLDMSTLRGIDSTMNAPFVSKSLYLVW